jgi:hypothetical protein
MDDGVHETLTKVIVGEEPPPPLLLPPQPANNDESKAMKASAADGRRVLLRFQISTKATMASSIHYVQQSKSEDLRLRLGGANPPEPFGPHCL